jgi:hypothetical protein
VRNIEGPGNLAHRLALDVAPPDRLAYLVGGEFRLAPHLHAPRLGAFPALARAGADQVALEFRQPPEDRQHKASMRGRGVGPCVAEGPESGSPASNRRKRIQEVAG